MRLGSYSYIRWKESKWNLLTTIQLDDIIDNIKLFCNLCLAYCLNRVWKLVYIIIQ